MLMKFPLSLEVQLALMAQIVLAAFLCMIIGISRERRSKSAGVRTHMLVGVGACLFTILSIYAFPNADTSRVAANVVTGIGFLGAGLIVQRKRDVYDLTTAAGVWVAAAIGMAVGAGAWIIAIFSTVMVWVIFEVIVLFKPTNGNHNEDGNGHDANSESETT